MWNIFSWIDALEDNFGASLIRWRWLIIVVSIGVCIVAANGLRSLEFDATYRSFFEKNYPRLMEFDRMEVDYSDSEGLLLMIDFGKPGEVFQRKNLTLIQKLTKSSWLTPHSVRVDSLSNFQRITASGDDLVVASLLPDDLASVSDAQLLKIEEIALSEPSIVRQTLSVDSRVAAIFISTNKANELLSEREEILHYLNSLVDQSQSERPDLKFYLTGRLTVHEGMLKNIERDIVSVIPLAGVLMMLFMWALTRSLWATILTSVVITMSLVCGIGAAGYLHLTLAGSSIIAPIAILTVAAASSVHLLVGFLNMLRAGAGVSAALRESVRLNLQPIVLTCLSTSLGFLSILLSDVPSFRVMGTIVAIGVMSSMFWVVVFLPAVLSFFPRRSAKKLALTTANKESDQLSKGVGRLVVRYKYQALFMVSSLVVLMVYGVSKLSLNDDYIEFLKPGQAERVAVDFGNEHLSSFYTVQFELKVDEESGALTPEFLADVDRFTEWLREQPEVLNVLSLSDIMKRLNRSMHAESEAWYVIPDSRELAAQYFLLYEMSLPYGLDVTNIINSDRSATRVIVRLSAVKSTQFLHLEQRIKDWQIENFDIIEASDAIGIVPMFSAVGRANAINMLKVTAIALFGISLLLIFMLRSVRMGLISLIPNMVPAAMGFGLWGYIDGEVTLVISLIATMTLGIVVDDTVHFLSKYSRARREHSMTASEAVVYSFGSVGPALVVTSLMLVAGFLSLMLSAFQPNVSIGLMTSIVIFFALIADFFFLPPILILLDRERNAVPAIQSESGAA